MKDKLDSSLKMRAFSGWKYDITIDKTFRYFKNIGDKK